MRLASLAAAALLAAGCGTLPAPVAAGPDWYPGFPRSAEVDGVFAEAAWRDDHAARLGVDLVDTGVVPIFVRVGALAGAPPGAALADDRLDAHLYLQDGTVLERVAPERVAPRGTRAADAALDGALEMTRLGPWETAPEGVLFFAYDGDDVRVRDGFALAATTGGWRELDLVESLLALTVTTDLGPRQLYVGVRPGGGGP